MKNTPDGTDTGYRVRNIRSLQGVVEGQRTGESQRTLSLKFLAQGTNLPLNFGGCFVGDLLWGVRSRVPVHSLQRQVARSR